MQPLHKKVKQATSTSKGKIIFITIVLLICSAVTLSVIYWNTVKKTFIREKINSVVQDKSNRLYRVHYDDMELDERSGFLSVKNLLLYYDTTEYKRLSNKDIPGTLFRIKIPLIEITGVKTPQALLTKEIIGRKVEIREPDIEIIYTHRGSDSTKGAPATEVYRQILGDLQLIKIDSFLITHAKITTHDIATGQQKLLLTDTYLELRDVAVDSIANKDDSRMLFSKHLLLNCSRLSWTSANKLYNYAISNITLSSDEQKLSAKSFRVLPTLNEIKFAQKKIFQADRYDITLNNIGINRLDFSALLKNKIFAESITLANSSIKIYRDMTRKPDGKSRLGTYPQQRIQHLPLPVSVKTIVLKNSYVEYKEKGRLMQKTGKVIFSDVNATFANITNIKLNGKDNSMLTADITANFLKRYPVSTSWRFYPNNKSGRFDVSGHVGSLNAPGLNELLVPLGGIRIEKGKINKLSFDLSADNYSMKGPVNFSYNNLKISLLKQDEETKALSRKKLVSMGANMLIYNDNPTKNKPLRIGEANFTRDTTRSMFHLCWETLKDGIKSSAVKH